MIKVLKDLGYVNKMGQVSVDEFKVNWSLVDNVAIHGKEEKSNGPDLVNIGSCGIHCAWIACQGIEGDRLEPRTLKSFYKKKLFEQFTWSRLLSLA